MFQKRGEGFLCAEVAALLVVGLAQKKSCSSQAFIEPEGPLESVACLVEFVLLFQQDLARKHPHDRLFGACSDGFFDPGHGFGSLSFLDEIDSANTLQQTRTMST